MVDDAKTAQAARSGCGEVEALRADAINSSKTSAEPALPEGVILTRSSAPDADLSFAVQGFSEIGYCDSVDSSWNARVINGGA